ncbi:malonate decarboxylase subunit epsilon [Alkalihalophilus lindianensis]|uniref:Malonyl CoA-acyl carrier protein transacylase n=1 Tax=Alkalihalophilus lindianensis TaxID=1630542 RepID=A0ABU3XDJ4_9BACI|nr:malonate decarboxylase subunit epsilon [Alkalihalophilus lindianensis]MDV2685960.1 malonate decarboxylase subunit epsilon [Alkalihalophilus lindianensis]
MSVAYLFPGQGSQLPSMLHSLPEHSTITNTIVEASEAIKEDVLTLDSPLALQSTINVQICLLTAGIAVARTLKEEGVHPLFVAGHSVGAFGAAVTSGVLEFSEAVRLVKLRGTLMEDKTPSGYGMGVIVGLSEKKLASIISGIHSETSPIYLTNRNSPDQMTISGSDQAVKQVLLIAKNEKARKAEQLDVNVPSHCPIFSHVSDLLESHLQKLKVSDPLIPYVSNLKARRLIKKEEIIADLAQSISSPVLWHDVTTTLYELGVRLFIEMPPGQVLTDLSKQSFPEARSIAVSMSGLKTVQVLMKRELNY